jgi:hypothetical protein
MDFPEKSGWLYLRFGKLARQEAIQTGNGPPESVTHSPEAFLSSFGGQEESQSPDPTAVVGTFAPSLSPSKSPSRPLSMEGTGCRLGRRRFIQSPRSSKIE